LRRNQLFPEFVVEQNFAEKFAKRPPLGAPQPKVDGADVAAMFLTLFGPPKKK